MFIYNISAHYTITSANMTQSRKTIEEGILLWLVVLLLFSEKSGTKKK